MKVVLVLLAVCACSLALDDMETGSVGIKMGAPSFNVTMADCKFGRADFSNLQNDVK